MVSTDDDWAADFEPMKHTAPQPLDAMEHAQVFQLAREHPELTWVEMMRAVNRTGDARDLLRMGDTFALHGAGEDPNKLQVWELLVLAKLVVKVAAPSAAMLTETSKRRLRVLYAMRQCSPEERQAVLGIISTQGADGNVLLLVETFLTEAFDFEGLGVAPRKAARDFRKGSLQCRWTSAGSCGIGRWR